MTTDKPKFVYVTYISTTPDKVFAALMDGEMTKQYWGLHKNVSDWKPGSEWSHQDYETGDVHVTGKVLGIDAPRRLVLTWKSPKAEETSRVTFQIDPFMDSVKLTVTHEDIVVDSPMWKGISMGWPAVLSGLKTLIETGKPLPMMTRRWGGPPPEKSETA